MKKKEATPLKNMRKYHNYIKRVFIDKYVSVPNTKLLDFACGKGGDIVKWKSNNFIQKVVGYDINENSIIEAKRRLEKYKTSKDISFFVKDLSLSKLNCLEKFDIITSNFAFHYFLKNKNSLDTVLKSIKNCSKKGTILILTLLDGEKLNKIKGLKTENYYIKKIQTKSKSQYNRKIEVFIKGSVLDVPEIEYITCPDFLIKKMNSIDFKLIESASFDELEYTKFNLSKDEKTYSFLNRIFVFMKLN